MGNSCNSGDHSDVVRAEQLNDSLRDQLVKTEKQYRDFRYLADAEKEAAKDREIELNAQVLSLETTVTSLEADVHRLNELDKDRMNQIESLRTLNGETEKELVLTKEKLSKPYYKKQQKNIDKQKEKISQKEADLKTREKKVKHLEDRAKDVQLREEEVTKREQKCASWENALERSEKQQMVKWQKHLEEVAQKQSSIASAQQQADALRDVLSQSRTEVKKMEDEIRQKSVKLKELEQATKEKEQKAEMILAKEKEVLQKHEEVTKIHKEHQEKHAEVKARLSVVTEQAEMLRKKEEEVLLRQQEVEEAKRQHEVQQLEHRRTVADLSRQLTEIQSEREELEQARTKHTEREEELEQKADELRFKEQAIERTFHASRVQHDDTPQTYSKSRTSMFQSEPDGNFKANRVGVLAVSSVGGNMYVEGARLQRQLADASAPPKVKKTSPELPPRPAGATTLPPPPQNIHRPNYEI